MKKIVKWYHVLCTNDAKYFSLWIEYNPVIFFLVSFQTSGAMQAMLMS